MDDVQWQQSPEEAGAAAWRSSRDRLDARGSRTSANN